MKSLLKFVLIGFVLNLFSVPLKVMSVEASVVLCIGFLLFLLASYVIFRRYGTATASSVILAGLVAGLVIACFEPIIISIRFRLQLYFLLDVSVRLLGIVCGFLLWRVKSAARFLPVLAGCLFVIFVVVRGDALWQHFCLYGNFTGKVAPQKFTNFEPAGMDQNGVRISSETFENKTVLLDFWHTRCGYCFDGFPSLQAAYNRSKNDPSVAIFAVDKPLDEDADGQAFGMIKDIGFDFPVMLPADPELPERFGIAVYPTTLVLDPDGNVIYRGSLQGAIALIDPAMQ